VARRYGFQEYDGPPLEPLELYTDKSGAEIVQQLYAFEDKGGRKVALRPEMTPALARMVGARAQALKKPIRWFSIPQLFRYERQQRGRLREHFQRNMDIIGAAAWGASGVGRLLGIASSEGSEAGLAELRRGPDGPAAGESLVAVITALGAMGLSEFVEVDLTVVRGLAYYTGTVFELFDRAKE